MYRSTFINHHMRFFSHDHRGFGWSPGSARPGCASEARHLAIRENLRITDSLPSGKHRKSYRKWQFIVSFPMKNCGSFHSFLLTFTRGYVPGSSKGSQLEGSKNPTPLVCINGIGMAPIWRSWVLDVLPIMDTSWNKIMETHGTSSQVQRWPGERWPRFRAA